MGKTYTFRLKKGMARKAMKEAKKIAKKEGISIKGSKVSGSGFKGSYSISKDTVTMIIDSIPWIIWWGLVESELKKFFKPYVLNN